MGRTLADLTRAARDREELSIDVNGMVWKIPTSTASDSYKNHNHNVHLISLKSLQFADLQDRLPEILARKHPDQTLSSIVNAVSNTHLSLELAL